jgi:hypothetical protein
MIQNSLCVDQVSHKVRWSGHNGEIVCRCTMSGNRNACRMHSQPSAHNNAVVTSRGFFVATTVAVAVHFFDPGWPRCCGHSSGKSRAA